MSHHNSIQDRQPTKKVFPKPEPVVQDRSIGNLPVPLSEELLIPGQGTFVFKLSDTEAQEIKITFTSSPDDALQLTVNKDGAAFNYRSQDHPDWTEVEAINENPIVTPEDGYRTALDPNPDCIYWVSIDSINKHLRYGKGEMRLGTALIDLQYDEPLSLFTKDNEPVLPMIGKLKKFEASAAVQAATLWKDPVVSEPPLFVVPSREFTMDDAALGRKTTPNSLSKECQILYGNVADFELNTPDFPDFAQAIEYSIRTEGCLGHRIIKKKLDENTFGKHSGAYKEVYLRITLGYAQGESPGIPYVMEIWPVGCASPVHHHGYTNAIIKVLRGAIDVDLFRMLPIDASAAKPLDIVTFEQGDVTYLMPEVNQYHLLKNNLKNTATCITIQCYSYAQDDDAHYAYFDYVEHDQRGQFDPISDCDYQEFKATVRKEWETYLKDKFWMKKKKEDAPKE